MKSNLSIIISREFSERVAKKSFIVTTILTPFLLVLFMAAPALIMNLSTSPNKMIAVIDRSEVVLPELMRESKNIDNLTLVNTRASIDSIRNDESYDGLIVIEKDIVTNPSNASLYLRESNSMELETAFNTAISKAVEDQRLKKYNISNLDRIMEEVKAETQVRTYRLDQSGEKESLSGTMSFALGMIMTFILYMFLIMYGQMVMTSIIEEKGNRVLELIVSSVKPAQLMLGKIIGIGLVAILQVAIWALLICTFSGFLLPMLMPEDLMQQVGSFNAGTLDTSSANVDLDMVKTMSTLLSVGFIAKLFLYLLVFLVGGFLFYAAIFAAIGSAVDNVQDASQLQTFAILPILIAFVFSLSLAQDPNSTAAIWMSMIPFTSPMVMLSRIPFEVPEWQIWVSAVILYASFVAMAWIAGKIYRVGIFMYGKKPSIKDLVRWARYK